MKPLAFLSVPAQSIPPQSPSVRWRSWLWLWLVALGLGAQNLQAAAPAAADKAVIPVFSLSGALTEQSIDESLPLFAAPTTSLKDLVERLSKAAEDPKVEAVVLLPEAVYLRAAQVEELRAALALVRARDKEVFVYADSLTMGDYLLACGASRISVVPTAMVLVPGLHGSTLHLRALLDKVGVQPDFLTEGAYKSAAEMYMREQPSPEADRMMNWLMDSWQESYLDLVARGRRVDVAKAKSWLDTGLFTADQALKAGLIDAVEQYADFQKTLKQRFGPDVVFEKRYGRKTQPEIDFSSPFAFLKIWTDLLGGPQKKAPAKPAVAIVYVDGAILPGKGQASPLGGQLGAFSTDIRRALEKAATDDSIKAVVLRVDSPGGSATASEIILAATERVKAKKPFIVSMGAVAGSGGYYVACAAQTIFADATTLTGSIGVLAGKLATTDMWRKLGITFKEYKRGQNAGILSTDAPFTESERARLLAYMDEVYATFKNHVLDSRRDRLKKPIDELAGGRVYTGKQALELGLVDRLGTLADAVAYAADLAKLKDYETRVVPEPKNFIEQLMEEISGGKEDKGEVSLATPTSPWLNLLTPALAGVDPQRVAAVTSALRRLEILRQEGVVLGMPEILQP